MQLLFWRKGGKWLIEENKILKGTEARFYKTIWGNVKLQEQKNIN